MKWMHGIAAGIVGFVVLMIVGAVCMMIFPQFEAAYANTALFRPMTDMASNIVFISPLLMGIILAWAWGKVGNNFNGSLFEKTLSFSAFTILLGLAPGMLMTYSSFAVDALMVLAWTVAAVLQTIATNYVIIRLSK